MAKKFKHLRAQMSPESQARAKSKTDQLTEEQKRKIWQANFDLEQLILKIARDK